VTSIIQTKRESSFIIIVSVPLILFAYAAFSPHFAHPDHYLHIAIHEAGLLIAGFLFCITVLTYMKTKLPRMLFSSLAFLTLVIAQAIYLISEMSLSSHTPIDYFSANEFFDILIVVMTLLFAVGVFYKTPTISH
jgi:hypothetical protein